MSDYKRFSVIDQAGVTVLRLNDPRMSDALEITELENELLDLISEQKPKNLLINYEVVTHCSTAVINGMLRAKKRMETEGGGFAMCEMRPIIREAYQILNLDGTVFQIFETQHEAVDHFG